MEGRDILRIYGDLAYRAAYGTACPWRHHQGQRLLPAEERAWNKSLSSSRIAVEQAFGSVQSLWTYTAFGKALRAGYQPVGAYFPVAVLLTNCYVCLRRTSASGSRFEVPPPTVEAYLLSTT